MHATTAAVDLAKNVFQVVLADAEHRLLEQHRLTRPQFERFFANRPIERIIMEARGCGHHWARTFSARGIEVILLSAHYVRAYVGRNKTDAADAKALLEAARDRELRPVRVKSIEQQALQALHRTRSLWMATRTARINALRGFWRAFGLHVPVGARTGLEAMGRATADEHSPRPGLIRPTMQLLLDEIRVLEARIAQIERQLSAVAAESEPCRLLMTIPGIGLLSSTAIAAATAGSVAHFTDARHFASWFGLTPKEFSSAVSDTSAESAPKATRTCACCSLTAPDPCCAPPPPPAPKATTKPASEPARSNSRPDPVTTRPPALWPTSSLASALACDAITRPSDNPQPGLAKNSNARPSASPTDLTNPLPAFASRRFAHHGYHGRTTTPTCR